ncbi:YfcC family protein [Pseudooceanicola sp. C21-150M6]|uniref:YfcC family protein n=1 Tax=Pseudooceanicola sp. C21-150M6 TaxID=3434355 RepID=UPI003D7F3026
MTDTTQDRATRKWQFPDPMVMIFYILLLASLLTLIVPAGSYEREEVGGATRVVPDSFAYTPSDGGFSIGGAVDFLFSIFVAIPRGLLDAAPYLFIVFIAGGLFHTMTKSQAMEHAIGTMVKHIGLERRGLIIWLGTYLYGLFGIAVGFENNIALVPVAMIISATIGYGNVVGVCMAVGGIGIGFALSPINPYTVGVSQTIADLPLFSGAIYRLILCLASLSLLALYITMYVVKLKDAAPEAGGAGLSKDISEYHMRKSDKIIIGAFALGIVVIAVCSYLSGTGTLGRPWYINEIAAVFLIISVVAAVASGMSANDYVANMIEGASKVTGGALVIGLAASIKIMLDDGGIIDTIIYGLNATAQAVPLQLLAPVMSVIQGVINFFVPSGSGQALVTMPILVPLADLTGMSRQLMIMAFQVGDGLTNLIVPTSGGTLAMLALGGVSYPLWMKVFMPFMVIVYLLCFAFLIAGHYIGY